MDKAILMYANINESPESCHIGHNTRKFHTLLEVINLMNVISETEFLGLLPWIQPRLCEFLKDVVNGGQAELSLHILRWIDLLYQRLITNKFLR